MSQHFCKDWMLLNVKHLLCNKNHVTFNYNDDNNDN